MYTATLSRPRVSNRDPSFARQLIALREKAGLTKYELAKRAGLSRQSLSLLEMGEREPTWETVQRLAAVLGVTCEQFTSPTLEVPTPFVEPTPPVKGRRKKEGK